MSDKTEFDLGMMDRQHHLLVPCFSEGGFGYVSRAQKSNVEDPSAWRNL
ncbi:MAG: hypothetical protein OXG25_14015 [Gammaproteobacteria bacterium]|nr:hypothetical protein [Gammaproteobacteria bacterium]